MQVLLLKCVVAQLHRDLHIRLKVLEGSQEMKGETMDKWRTDLLKETMLWRLFSVSATLGQLWALTHGFIHTCAVLPFCPEHDCAPYTDPAIRRLKLLIFFFVGHGMGLGPTKPIKTSRQKKPCGFISCHKQPSSIFVLRFQPVMKPSREVCTIHHAVRLLFLKQDPAVHASLSANASH